MTGHNSNGTSPSLCEEGAGGEVEQELIAHVESLIVSPPAIRIFRASLNAYRSPNARSIIINAWLRAFTPTSNSM